MFSSRVPSISFCLSLNKEALLNSLNVSALKPTVVDKAFNLKTCKLRQEGQVQCYIDYTCYLRSHRVKGHPVLMIIIACTLSIGSRACEFKCWYCETSFHEVMS